MTVNLKDKIALVTGASRGIGRSISLALAESGAHVVLSARSLDRLEEVEREITSFGGKATTIAADLAQEEQIVHLFEEVWQTFKRLDILINNAGVGLWGKLIDFSAEDFDKLMRVNLKGPYLCCQQAMRIMIPQKSGYIINVSSVQGVKGYENQSAYAASKHGIMGLSKSLANEAQEHNIRVSVILPAAVDTEMIKTVRPDLDSSVLIRPEDIARAVLFLLSLSDTAMVDQLCVRRMAGKPF